MPRPPKGSPPAQRPEPEGGRAAERLRQFEQQRHGTDADADPPHGDDDPRKPRGGPKPEREGPRPKKKEQP